MLVQARPWRLGLRNFTSANHPDIRGSTYHRLLPSPSTEHTTALTL